MLIEFFNIMSSDHIGKRIDCMGEIGTVKYVGSVQGHPATWLGIDWDNPQRGKHNGTVNGVVYFETIYPKSGSFVRPEKVNFGVSAVQAITSRYGQRDDEFTSKINEQQLLTIQKTIKAPFLQLVGFDKITDKQADFASLEIINLRMQNVNGIGKGLDLYNICPNIKELDISKNLINDWATIFDICTQLKNLTWLNISENLMVLPDDYQKHTFPNVRVLICSNMRLIWSDVLKFGKIFPNLEELRVPTNRITTLEAPPGNMFASLKLLDMEDNHIGDWAELNTLAGLPLLEQLILDNCNLKDIYFPITDGKKVEEFRAVKKLVLNNNDIDSWDAIEQLNRLKNLEDLRMLRNPLLNKETYDTCVQMFIARIGNLKSFNGSEIEAGERKGAEYDYLKKFGMEWLSVKDDPEKHYQFLTKHGRFLELTEIYGTPEESEMKVESKLLKVSLVDVSLVHNDKMISKKVPPTLLIQKLIMMVQRIFNLTDRPRLLYTSGDIEIVLDDEGKELGFYSIQSGDRIIVQT